MSARAREANDWHPAVGNQPRLRRRQLVGAGVSATDTDRYDSNAPGLRPRAPTETAVSVSRTRHEKGLTSSRIGGNLAGEIVVRPPVRDRSGRLSAWAVSSSFIVRSSHTQYQVLRRAAHSGRRHRLPRCLADLSSRSRSRPHSYSYSVVAHFCTRAGKCQWLRPI